MLSVPSAPCVYNMCIETYLVNTEEYINQLHYGQVGEAST